MIAKYVFLLLLFLKGEMISNAVSDIYESGWRLKRIQCNGIVMVVIPLQPGQDLDLNR